MPTEDQIRWFESKVENKGDSRSYESITCAQCGNYPVAVRKRDAWIAEHYPHQEQENNMEKQTTIADAKNALLLQMIAYNSVDVHLYAAAVKALVKAELLEVRVKQEKQLYERENQTGTRDQ